jgi:hypothetical protein
MDLSTFLFGTALTILPLVAAGLLAAMVMLERSAERLSPTPAHAGGAPGRQRRRHRRPGRSRRA